MSSEKDSASTNTSSKPKKKHSKKKELDWQNPFVRVDPKLLEKMHREAVRKRTEDALL
jgi:ribosomal protein S25